MSRSKKDQRGGHPWAGYDKENSVAKDMTRQKRRAANKKFAKRSEWIGEEDEQFEPDPEKSTQGWLTW